MKVSEGKSWKDTLLEVLPQRKFKAPNLKKKNRNESMDDDSIDNEMEIKTEELQEKPEVKIIENTI